MLETVSYVDENATPKCKQMKITSGLTRKKQLTRRQGYKLQTCMQNAMHVCCLVPIMDTVHVA